MSKQDKEIDRLRGLLREVRETLNDADLTICSLCKIVNPPHSDCEICPDREDRLIILSRITAEVDEIDRLRGLLREEYASNKRDISVPEEYRRERNALDILPEM